jgi:hypothetical protein
MVATIPKHVVLHCLYKRGVENHKFVCFLYGCETWSLTLSKERRLSVLRKIFGPKRDEVTVDWRKLHNEEHNDLYCSPNIVRVIK